MKIPSYPWTLMKRVYKEVLPLVHGELDHWKGRAQFIPNAELRTQALASIDSKTFHCEGGGIYALLSSGQARQKDVIKFVVAYQTISDYLDNLCDRSTSLDPVDFAQLHRSMPHALTPGMDLENYYSYREEQDDGGYLHELVTTCQNVLRQLPGFPYIEQTLKELAEHYCNLQIHKHVKKEERIPRLKDWFEQNKEHLPVMSWYEFSACAGSTIGIFCLVSYATHDDFQSDWVIKIKEGYFPWIQGLHIMMDYLIDQEEDRHGGDLNFCFYYADQNEMITRLLHFFKKADESTRELPHARFHSLVTRGLLGMYASDEKVRLQKDVRQVTKRLMREGGMTAYYYYWNSLAYRKIKA
ncbi:tetraprenyl-beta-curcumene synthase family protein [Alkalihalobacillus sp. AL-G]|uniref:tetraprenyl-beta-curcumene synthase family protein n=1 Tax=Alkalihalobacillus sp. AL-G TaxID=2926399 RepID=UPI00272BAAAC|nr:tetraprenyl-beta-curcumene synthase family protein [Alkalihalobacillus sp. AL-G]WLD92451.1 tetraprenyl-beta-curcumene synthase family protein [Alkalihalobacillus sp. AL-G]